jgi:hypothetical protein
MLYSIYIHTYIRTYIHIYTHTHTHTHTESHLRREHGGDESLEAEVPIPGLVPERGKREREEERGGIIVRIGCYDS